MKELTKTGKKLVIVCFFSVLSQLPIFIELKISSAMTQIIWIVLLILLLFKNNMKFTIKKNVVYVGSLVVCVIISSMITSLITGTNYCGTSLFTSIILSFFVLVVGSMAGTDINLYDLEKCGTAYSLASFLVAINIYFDFFHNNEIQGSSYLYASKNSIAVIFMTALCIVYYGKWNSKKKFANFFKVIELLTFTYMIMVMKCRAMIVILPIVYIFPLFKRSTSKKVKVLIIMICVASFILLQNNMIYDRLINDIILAGRGSDINDISSGRFDMFINFNADMKGKWLIGDGKTFKECFYLASIIQYGLVIGSVFIIFAISPLIFLSMLQKKKNHMGIIFMIIICVYLEDGLFEQLSPLGPGTRCFFVWLLFGIAISNRKLFIK